MNPIINVLSEISNKNLEINKTSNPYGTPTVDMDELEKRIFFYNNFFNREIIIKALIKRKEKETYEWFSSKIEEKSSKVIKKWWDEISDKVKIMVLKYIMDWENISNISIGFSKLIPHFDVEFIDTFLKEGSETKLELDKQKYLNEIKLSLKNGATDNFILGISKEFIKQKLIPFLDLEDENFKPIFDEFNVLFDKYDFYIGDNVVSSEMDLIISIIKNSEHKLEGNNWLYIYEGLVIDDENRKVILLDKNAIGICNIFSLKNEKVIQNNYLIKEIEDKEIIKIKGINLEKKVKEIPTFSTEITNPEDSTLYNFNDFQDFTDFSEINE